MKRSLLVYAGAVALGAAILRRTEVLPERG